MNNVIDLKPYFERVEEGREETPSRQVGRLRKRLDARHVLKGKEPETLARNLHQLLSGYERSASFSRAKLCQEVFHSKATDSSKRLREFTLPGGLANANRLATLAKDGRKYLKLSECAARLANQNPDDAVLATFRGSRFLRPPSDSDIDPMDEDLKADAVRQIDRACAAIATSCDLQTAFRLLSRYRSIDGHIVGSIRPEPYDIKHGACLDHELGQLIRGFPQVCIGGFEVEKRADEIYKWDRSSRSDDEEFRWPNKIILSDLEAWSSLWVKLWLAIVPFGPNQMPKAAILVRLGSEHSDVRQVRTPAEDNAARPTFAEFDNQLRNRVRDSLWEAGGYREPFVRDSREHSHPATGEPIVVRVSQQTKSWAGSFLGGPIATTKVLDLMSAEAVSLLELPDGLFHEWDWVGPIEEEVPDDEIVDILSSDDPDNTPASRYTPFAYGEFSETTAYGWPKGSLGWKLERSELSCPIGSRPTDFLEVFVKDLVKKTKLAVDLALKERQQRFDTRDSE